MKYEGEVTLKYRLVTNEDEDALSAIEDWDCWLVINGKEHEVEDPDDILWILLTHERGQL